MDRVIDYDVVLMQRDMASRGWEAIDLAVKIRRNRSTISRFFGAGPRTNRVAKRIAKALGHPIERYMLVGDGTVATTQAVEARP